MKKPLLKLTGLCLLALSLASLTLVEKKVDSILVSSDKYLDVSGFDHMEVEVQNDFTCSKQSINWSLFGELPITRVDWNIDSNNGGHIIYTVFSTDMQGEVKVDLDQSEIKLKIITKDYGLIHWLLVIDDVNLEVG